MRERLSNEYLDTVLKEMCSRVGADFDKIDFMDGRWFTQYKWSDRQEISFVVWLTKYIQTNKKARQSITSLLGNNKKLCRRFAESFVFYCGWSTKNE